MGFKFHCPFSITVKDKLNNYQLSDFDNNVANVRHQWYVTFTCLFSFYCTIRHKYPSWVMNVQCMSSPCRKPLVELSGEIVMPPGDVCDSGFPILNHCEDIVVNSQMNLITISHRTGLIINIACTCLVSTYTPPFQILYIFIGMVNVQYISRPNRTASLSLVEISCEEMSTPPNHGRDSRLTLCSECSQSL